MKAVLLALFPSLLMAVSLAEVAPAPTGFTSGWVAAAGERCAIASGSIGFLGYPALAAVLLLAAPALRRSEEDRPAARKLRMYGLAFVVGWLLFFAAPELLNTADDALRDLRVKAIPARAAPLIAALKDFRRDRGHYPETLSEVVPSYLPAIPGTGMLGSPNFQYERSDGTDLWRSMRGGNVPYDLWFECDPNPDYICLDSMHYWPSRRYPKRMFYGEVTRVDGWARARDPEPL